MNRTIGIAALVVAGSLPAQAQGQGRRGDTRAVGPSTEPPLAVRGVTLIDGRGGEPQRDRTVLVRDGRIAAIGGRELTLPPNTRVLNAAGKFMIPGLCDAHAHFRYGTSSLDRFLANGVTCLREMFGNPREVADWRARIERGVLAGPHILTVAQGITEGANASAATAVLDSAAQSGATFIKLGDRIPRATFDRLMTEARARHVAVLGHLPYPVSAIDAARSGIRSIEHANRLVFDAAIGGDSLRAALWTANRTSRFSLYAAALDGYDAARSWALARALAASGVAFTPTLISARRLAMRNDSAFHSDARLRDIPAATQAEWRHETAETRHDSVQRSIAYRLYARQQQLVRLLDSAGVHILAGTDAGDTYVYDGSSLHDELMELVRAGLTPMASLLAATRNVAEVAGVTASIGTIAAGKAADLVLLDADPLADIANVRRIRAVIRGGRLYERAELDRMRGGRARPAPNARR
jgi:imidazolonepropionase-like amidohydrolase